MKLIQAINYSMSANVWNNENMSYPHLYEQITFIDQYKGLNNNKILSAKHY